MEKVRVAICIPTTNMGGAETMAAQLAKALNKDLFDVSFIVNHSLDSGRVLDIVKDEKIKIYSLNENQGMSFRALRKMYKLLGIIKPQIIHTHLHTYPYVMTYAIFHHIKIIHTMHNMPIYESTKTGQRILRFLFKHKYAYPVGISSIITDQIKKVYKLKDVMTIYNPVDTSKFVPNNENHDKFTFITIGRMSPQKNQALLLKSFSNIVNYDKNVSLIFIGDGELKEELFALTKQLNIENYVKYIGNVSNVECFLNKADVFVLSSIYEGLPMTILEAMSIGLPIISTNVGGVKDVVTDNGLLVGVNENELTEAMELIMHSKEKYNYFANNSKKNAKNFNLEKIAEEYEKVYFNHLKRKEVKGK